MTTQRAKAEGEGIRIERSPEPLIDFAIITALEVERLAVCKAFKLTNKDKVRKKSRVYWRGKLPLKNGEFYEVVVAQSPDMANVDAALLTSDTIHHWNLGALLLVGIAAAASDGTGPDDEALGDIVVGSDVYYYERGKITPAGKKQEPKMYKADATLWSHVTALPKPAGRLPARPDGKRERPKIHLAVIACGEKVIAEEAARDEIASGHRKIRAIEMEGYGFSAAAYQSFEQRRHLVIKAICDRADRNKAEDWQPYAAAVAAGFAKHFLRDRPLEPSNPSKSGKEKSVDELTGESVFVTQSERQVELSREEIESILNDLKDPESFTRRSALQKIENSQDPFNPVPLHPRIQDRLLGMVADEHMPDGDRASALYCLSRQSAFAWSLSKKLLTIWLEKSCGPELTKRSMYNFFVDPSNAEGLNLLIETLSSEVSIPPTALPEMVKIINSRLHGDPRPDLSHEEIAAIRKITGKYINHDNQDVQEFVKHIAQILDRGY